MIEVAHARWRGLCHQDRKSSCVNDPITAWFGPAIGPTAFEVGEGVVEAFLSPGIGFPSNAFVAIEQKPSKYLADIYLLARSCLEAVLLVYRILLVVIAVRGYPIRSFFLLSPRWGDWTICEFDLNRGFPYSLLEVRVSTRLVIHLGLLCITL